MGTPFYYLLHPRPAYIIGSGRIDGKFNFMAASWVSPVSEEPERVALALDKECYTYQLIRETGEFTVNVLPLSSVDLIFCTGSVSGRSVDKASSCKITPRSGKRVSAPVVGEAIGFLECEVDSWMDLGDTELVVGRVLYWEAIGGLFTDRGWNLRKVSIPLHLWGRVFASTGKVVVAKK